MVEMSVKNRKEIHDMIVLSAFGCTRFEPRIVWSHQADVFHYNLGFRSTSMFAVLRVKSDGRAERDSSVSVCSVRHDQGWDRRDFMTRLLWGKMAGEFVTGMSRGRMFVPGPAMMTYNRCAGAS